MNLLTVGYVLIGVAPLVAVFISFLSNKSFLVLLTFLSAFFWLVVLSITSAIFRAFLPFQPAASSYAGVLLVSVGIQELARLGLCKAHRLVVEFLEQHASRSGKELRQLDRVYLAMGLGLGHATTHSLFFFASLVPLTAQGGTWYLDSCPAMNVFLAGSLLSLSFSFLLVSTMVLALEGGIVGFLGDRANTHSRDHSQLPLQLPVQQQQQQQQQQRGSDIIHQAFDVGGRGKQLGLAFSVHLVAALMMLLNFVHNGCLATTPLLFILGLLCTAQACKVFQRAKAAALVPGRSAGLEVGQSDDESNEDRNGEESHVPLMESHDGGGRNVHKRRQ